MTEQTKIQTQILPDHDIPCDLDAEPFTTCSIPTPAIQRRVETSIAIQERVKNYKMIFNIVQDAHTSYINATPTIVTQETYNPSSLIPISQFLTCVAEPRTTMFHILDSFLFFINALNVLNTAHIFPLVLDPTNTSIHKHKLIPCMTNLVWCLTGDPSFDTDIASHIPHMSYSGFMSPDMFVLKYIHDNDIHIITPDTITKVMSLIRSHHEYIIPTSVCVDILENTHTYLTQYYLHMSRTSAVKYNSENVPKSARYSAVMLYVNTILHFFDISNDTVRTVFIVPVLKFLNPRSAFNTQTIYETIQNIFYEEAVHGSNFFDIIQIAFKSPTQVM